MKIQMKVFSVEASKRQCPVTLPDGTKVVATIECMKVQLVPGAGDDHGTMSVSLVGKEADEAKALKVDAVVSVTIETEEVEA